MIVELNGLAGVGKLTIGRILAPSLGGRLIDNHTIYNPAFATTEFRSDRFYETVRAVRQVTFEQATFLGSETAIVLTIAPGRNPTWGREWQIAIRDLADRRRCRLYGVHLFCAPEEGARRIVSPDRALLNKLRDPEAVRDGADRLVQLDHCDHVLNLDVTSLSASDAAEQIKAWLPTLIADL
jgi:hypothetical protein